MVKSKWKLLGKENIFRNQYVTLDTWKMRLPSGEFGDYFIHKSYDFVVVAAFTKEGQAIVLEQYYISQSKRVPTLVAGIIDKGENPAATAARELLEETGYKAEKIISLGSNIKGKYTTGQVFHFLALGAKKVAKPDLEAGEDIIVKIVSRDRFKKMISQGKISDGIMELGARRALEYLEK